VTVPNSDKPYVPAAGRHWRLPFYDLLAKLLGADQARRLLVEQLAPGLGDRVLDVGSGTGSLAIQIKRLHPRVDVVGLDPDPRALAIARRKAGRASVAIQFDRGFADALPYPDGSFDRVASSLTFHHLSRSDKERALREFRRVLKPGGRFHMLDFDGPADHAGFVTRHLHAHPQLRDNAEDRVLALMSAAGLENPKVVGRRVARLTHMSYYQASVPISGSRPT
jgi:ubiquinone/menaquinone biosynthesis C-methylase UbiE